LPHARSRLVLASSSPRRAELLSLLRVPFITLASTIPETLQPDADGIEVALSLATQKADNVAARLDNGLVIGADTVVLTDSGQIYSKPQDNSHASRMLRVMRNGTVTAVTGLCIVEVPTQERSSTTTQTHLAMRNYSEYEIHQYIKSGETPGKAGALAIQGDGRHLVEEIDGCFTNVIGLPMCALLTMLSKFRTWHQLTRWFGTSINYNSILHCSQDWCYRTPLEFKDCAETKSD
jgi:septum formation protein